MAREDACANAVGLAARLALRRAPAAEALLLELSDGLQLMMAQGRRRAAGCKCLARAQVSDFMCEVLGDLPSNYVNLKKHEYHITQS